MKILSFSSCFPSSADPISGIFVLRRLSALAKLAEVKVVHPISQFPYYRGMYPEPDAQQENLDDLEVYHPIYFYIPGLFKRFDPWFYSRGIFHWLRKHFCSSGKPDVLDAHFAWPDGVAVSYLARSLGIPCVITLRGTINPRYRIPCFKKRLSYAMRNASSVISVSKAMADIAVELGADPQSVYVIPNGVDTAMFRHAPAGQARIQLGLPEDAPLIVSVGSLKAPKGFEDLIKAVSSLPINVQLVIVGGQTDGGAYLRRLGKIVDEKGLAGRVTFAGRQPHETVATYLNAADVSVLASHAEGCPNVVLESLACGTPVVATSVGGIPELIRPGENGELVPVKEPNVLSETLRKSLSKSWSRESVRQSVDGRTWDSVAGRILCVFGTVLEKRL